MGIWVRGVMLGNLNESACVLNVTEGHFQDCLQQINELHDEAIDDLSDVAAFRFLDSALYLDEGRTNQELQEESLRYSKFIFLTNSGESFDGIKAFLLNSGDHFRILYRLDSGTTGNAHVTCNGLIDAMRGFLEWIAREKRAVLMT